MMLKEKGNKTENVKGCVKAVAFALGGCAILLVSYRLGAQHGVDVVEDWILQNDPDLHEQINTLYRKCVRIKGRG